MFLRRLTIVGAAFLAWGACQAYCSAQILIQRSVDTTPAVAKAFPVGWQRGQKVAVTFDGLRLQGAWGVLAPAGVKLLSVVSTEEKLAKVELEVAPDAPLGVFPLHLLCKAGISNPKLVRVDDLPQTVETEDNHRPEQATPLAMPLGVSGWLGETDIDYFRFDAVAGQRLTVDVEAQRLGSALRPSLTLLDAAGKELARASVPAQRLVRDVRLTYAFTASGAYLLKLTDRTFRGADFAVYHLRIADLPAADFMFPLGGRRGTRASVTFAGGSLAAPWQHEFDIPADAPSRRLPLEIPTPAGMLAAPALFAIGDYPESLEAEPNNDAAAAQLVAPPVTIDGRIEAPGDRDAFKVHLAQGAAVTVRVLAEELGSPLDAVVSLVDANGAEVQNVDDREGNDRNPPVVQAVRPARLLDDPQFEFRAPAEGDYTVFVDDRYGTGSPAHAYRLELAPQVAEFDLMVQPTVAAVANVQQDREQQQQQARVVELFAGEGTGVLSIDRGGSGVAAVRVIRRGAVGTISVRAENLPPGVECKPLEISGGQNDGLLNFVVDFDAPSGGSLVKIVGTATIAERPVRREAAQPVFLSSLPTNGGAQLELGALAVGVSQQGAELAVRAEFAAPLAQGGKTNLRVSLRRREGVNGEVTCVLNNVPLGFAVEGLALSPEDHQGELEISAGADAVVGKHTLLLLGTMPVADRPQPVVAVFPIEFELLPVVSLELPKQQVDLTAGGETTVTIRLRRNGDLTAPIELSLAPLPKGVSAASLEIPPGTDEYALVLKAAPDAMTGPIRRIVQLKAKTKIGDRTLELPSLRFALKVSKGS